MAYTARFERDESGWWVVEVPEVQGCRTKGRSIGEGRTRIREALARAMGGEQAQATELVDEVRLPPPVHRTLTQQKVVREKAIDAQAAVAVASVEAVRMLTKDAGVSTLDAAELLNISYQCVYQIARSPHAMRDLLLDLRQCAQGSFGHRRGSPVAREYADVLEDEYRADSDPHVRREIDAICEWLRSSSADVSPI